MDLAGVTIAFLPCIMTQTRVLGRSGVRLEKELEVGIHSIIVR